jgi:hypothetical protein
LTSIAPSVVRGGSFRRRTTLVRGRTCQIGRRPRPERQLGLIMIRRRVLQVRQELRDDLRLLDAGDHLELVATARADADLDIEYALAALRPTHRHVARCRSLV